MGKKSKAKNHHYIPQFYQRHFVTKRVKEIWNYSKSHPPKLRPIKTTGSLTNLYATGDGGELDVETIEGRLQKLETLAARSLEPVVYHRQFPDQKARLIISWFLVSMEYRRPANVERRRDPADFNRAGARQEILDNFDDVVADYLRERLPPESSEEQIRDSIEHSRDLVSRRREEFEVWSLRPDLYAGMVTADNSKVIEVIANHTWTILTAPDKADFVTCDRPVLFDRNGASQGVYFPLSDRLALMALSGKPGPEGFHEISAEEVEAYNLEIVRNSEKFVYSGRFMEGIERMVKSK